MTVQYRNLRLLISPNSEAAKKIRVLTNKREIERELEKEFTKGMRVIGIVT